MERAACPPFQLSIPHSAVRFPPLLTHSEQSQCRIAALVMGAVSRALNTKVALSPGPQMVVLFCGRRHL